MTDSPTNEGTQSRAFPQFEPRIPEFLLDKMTPAEKEIFCRLDVNSQQTEHTLRVVLEGHEERKKVVASVLAIRSDHAEHIAQDKADFGDLRKKHAEMSDNVTRCASTLDGWKAKLDTYGKALNFLFGRKGVMTGVLIAVLTYYAVDLVKQHRSESGVSRMPDTAKK